MSLKNIEVDDNFNFTLLGDFLVRSEWVEQSI
jgi:hypothetical protein